MSQASPFSGLIEMPQTGPPAGTTDEEVADTESGGGSGTSSSGGFKSFWENHQMIMMVIGLGVLLLTAVLVFRKSQSSSNAASNTTAAGGVPTVSTSDTAMAIDQQNTSIEALLNAFQKFTDNMKPGGTTPTPAPTGASALSTWQAAHPNWQSGMYAQEGLPAYGPDARTYIKVGANGVPNTLSGIASQQGLSLSYLSGLNRHFNNSQQIAAGTYIRTGGTAPWEYSKTGSSASGLSSIQNSLFGTSDVSASGVSRIEST